MKLDRSPSAATGWPCDFAAVGEGGVDLVCRLTTLPRPGAKHPLAGMASLAGGQAATAAVGCARLGWRSRWIGARGNDAAGASLAATMAREGVEFKGVVRPGASTRTAVVLVAAQSGERTVLEWRDPRLDIEPGELDADAGAARVVLVDATDVQLSLAIARKGRAAGSRFINDTDRVVEGIEALLELMDVVILPDAVIGDLTGFSEVGRGLAELGRGLPAAAVVVTLGGEGALAWCRGAEVRVPAYPMNDLQDTTGAGDAFRAAFAHAWLESAGTGPDLESLLRAAACGAALNCRGLGAQEGLPTREALAAALATWPDARV